MIYYDITKMGGKAPRSGLTRLSARLQRELGDAVVPAVWDGRSRGWRRAGGGAVELSPADWLLTVELFSESERPGFRDFIAQRPCRLAAMFHDAIPLKFPHITWPHSVQRHADYMKLLAGFDRSWAISRATRDDFLGFWRWQGVAARGEVGVVELGADFDGSARASAVVEAAATRRSLLCVGIIEPRKNHGFLLDVAEGLWREGVDFDLHVVGRVNPHFGAPYAKRMGRLARREPRFRYHAAANDAVLRGLYASARAVVFPTIAEGCGLPVLEALWRGVPCVCSDLPVLRENSAAGGCLSVPVNDPAAWAGALREVLQDDGTHGRLQREAVGRPLPRWADTAATLRAALA